MDTKSETKLILDPEVIESKESKQETTTIDAKYGISLFQKREKVNQLYSYENVQEQIYESSQDYKLNIATNRFANIYTVPEVYAVDTEISVGTYTNLMYIILILQIFTAVYFAIKIIKVRRKR